MSNEKAEMIGGKYPERMRHINGNISLSCPNPDAKLYVQNPPNMNEYVIPFLKIEQDQAYTRMKALGINTEAQTFEQCVNELLHRLEDELQPVNKTEEELVKEDSIIKRAIAIEDEIIGNLKVQFMKKSLREQIHMEASPSLIVGNISLAFQRGMAYGKSIASILPRREADKELLEALKNSTEILKSIMGLFGDGMALSTKFGITTQIKENEAIRNAEKETK